MLAGGWESACNERLGVVGDGIVHAYTLDAARRSARNHLGHEVALRPFLGVMGMPPASPASTRRSRRAPAAATSTARSSSAASTLWLPIEVDGALFSCGDGHAAQGDGEVAGTAIECPLERAELTFALATTSPLTTPLARGADGAGSPSASHEDLDEAAFIALDAMLDADRRASTASPARDALALASLHVDLRITQMVNQVQGVHAVLRGFGETVQ